MLWLMEWTQFAHSNSSSKTSRTYAPNAAGCQLPVFKAKPSPEITLNWGKLPQARLFLAIFPQRYPASCHWSIWEYKGKALLATAWHHLGRPLPFQSSLEEPAVAFLETINTSNFYPLPSPAFFPFLL